MRRPSAPTSRWQQLALLALFALPAALPDSAFAQSLAVRFHPAKALYTYPLESTRNLQGLLLQNVVVANTGSVRVKVGDTVVAGQPVGRLGSSGNSTEPHLHFHVCDKPAVLHCAGLPVVFDDIELPYADAPRPVQTGDVVVTKATR